MNPVTLNILWLENADPDLGLPGANYLTAVGETKSIHIETAQIIPSQSRLKLSNGLVPDVVVIDGCTDVKDLLDVIMKAQSQNPNAALVVIGTKDDDVIAAKVYGKGAQDYIVKDTVTSEDLRRRLRHAVLKKAVDRQKSHLLGVITHELKAPTAIIREASAQLQEGYYGRLKADQIKCLSAVSRSTDRLKHMIDELLETTELDTGNMKLNRHAVLVQSIVHDAVNSFRTRAAKKKITIRAQFLSRGLKAFADADRLAQVFNNLIGNAIKFTNKGRINIELSEKNDRVVCRISDTGRGMAPEDLPHIFDKFKQAGFKLSGGDRGLGLGLSIVKGIIEDHEGTIRVESLLDQGTTFTFDLPKYSSKYEFQEYITERLPKISKTGQGLSVIIFGTGTSPDKKLTKVLEGMEVLIKSELRNENDKVFNSDDTTLAVLQEAGKKDAVIVAERIQKMIDRKFSKKALLKDSGFRFNVVSYPEDVKSTLEFIKRAHIEP
jgi:signal transduction histidine kinase